MSALWAFDGKTYLELPNIFLKLLLRRMRIGYGLTRSELFQILLDITIKSVLRVFHRLYLSGA